METYEIPCQDVKISVILATMNCGRTLPFALDSVISQRDVDCECIVIDGGSTDGTVEVIQDKEKAIDYWISEPDGGIAEAFNKGVKASSGRLLYFLGADDVLHDEMVFHDVLSYIPQMNEPYFFYGDLFYTYQKKKKLIQENYAYLKFRQYNCIPHQAMFLDRFFFQTFGLFDTRFKYAMDYEFISRFIENHRPQYIKRVIAEMQRNGVSTDVLPVHKEMDRVRLRKGWATSRQATAERLLLRIKFGLVKLLKLDW